MPGIATMRIRTNVRDGERPIKNSKTGLRQPTVTASVQLLWKPRDI